MFWSREKSGTEVDFKRIPQQSGVYFFYDLNKKLLYIGKANNLHDRIKSHFLNDFAHSAKSKMIAQTEKVTWQITNSDIEALIKEAELIKKYRPFYNVALRDDKSYFFVEITAEKFPRIFITHETQKNPKSIHIGPFTDGNILRTVLKYLRRGFPYCTCLKQHSRKCINTEMGKCLNFCCNKDYTASGKNLEKEYGKNIKNITAVLTGKRQALVKKIKKEMKEFSRQNDYELAAKLRDQITGIEQIFKHKPVLKTIKKRESEYGNEILEKIRSLLNLPKIPLRIETYDISNIQGKFAVGAMAVFENGQPNKKEHRKFRIRLKNEPDDTAMIKEVLSRRLRHREWFMPDLLVIDGGRGQLNTALEAMRTACLKIPALALAKKEEELYIPERQMPIRLRELNIDILYLFQQMRDEAHRLAIGYHKKLMAKSIK